MGSLQRYFIRFSYIGTKFRGYQVQTKAGGRDLKTVQGVMESGLQFLRPINDPMVHGASRTDVGVHAIDNALHVDLIRRCKTNEAQEHYEPEVITHSLNSYFSKLDVDIRIKSTRKVSKYFNSRIHSSKRHYIYRLIVPSSEENAKLIKNKKISFPILENDRAWIVRENLNISALREGCALLSREADFSSFMSKNNDECDTLRNLQVDISPAYTTIDMNFEPLYGVADVYNINFSSKGFLYNQVRRCVAILVAYASGKVSASDVEAMFLSPHTNHFPTDVALAPPSGLYLAKLEYPDHVFDSNFRSDKKESEFNFRGFIEEVSPKIVNSESDCNIKYFKEIDDLVKKFKYESKSNVSNSYCDDATKRTLYRELYSLLTYRKIIDRDINKAFNKLKEFVRKANKLSDEEFFNNVQNEMELYREEHLAMKMRKVLKTRSYAFKKVLQFMKK